MGRGLRLKEVKWAAESAKLGGRSAFFGAKTTRYAVSSLALEIRTSRNVTNRTKKLKAELPESLALSAARFSS